MKKFRALIKQIKQKRIFIPLIVVLLIAGILGFRNYQNSNQEVEKTTVQKGIVTEELTLSGEIDAVEKTDLQFEIPGKLAWVGVKVGDYVQAYQTVATLDSRSAQKSIQNALLDYSKQRNDFEQTQDNNANRRPNQALNDQMKRILENNQYDLDKSIVSVELQDLIQQQSALMTPIAGIVTSAQAPYPGITVSIGTPQFQVVNPNTIYFSVSADQTEIVKLKEGARGSIFFDAYSDDEIFGTIERISFVPKANETDTVYEVKVKLEIDNTSYKYRIGMTGDISFITGQKKDALYIENKFIKSDDQGTYVLVGEKREKKYIETGLETEDITEIEEGIAVNTVVYD